MAATLKIGNDCGPCCDCASFAAVQKHALAVYDRLARLSQRRDTIQADHVANIANWISQKSCRESQPVSVNLLAHHDYQVEGAAAICNRTATCARNVTLRVELKITPASSSFILDPKSVYTVDPIYGTKPATLNPVPPLYGGNVAYTVIFDAIPSQTSASLRFGVALVKSQPKVQFTLIGVSSLTYNGVVPPPVSKTVEI